MALLAGLALLPMPLLVYLGHCVCHETLGLTFALAALRGYFGWLRPDQFDHRPARNATLFAAGTVLVILTTWAGLLFAGVTWLHFAVQVLTRKRHASAAAWCLVTLPPGLAAGATFTHVLWSMNWRLDHLVGLFTYRSGINQSQISFTLTEWLGQQGEWLWRNYTLAGVALAVLGLLLAMHARLTRSDRPAGKLLTYAGPLVIPGLLWVIVLSNGSLRHEYWWLHATPFVALLIASALSWLGETMNRLSRVAGPVTMGLLVVAMAAEAVAHYGYFRKGSHGELRIRLPSEYIRARTPEDAWVLGNGGLWSRKDYYEGPQEILHPSFAWYLDRYYVQARTPREIAALARRARYYLLRPRQRDLPLAEYLSRSFKLEAQWQGAYIFDLAAPRRAP